MPHSHGLLHHLVHNFDWAFEVEALTRSHVQLQRNGVQLLLAMYRQVCALGQVLANQAVDVFVGIWKEVLLAPSLAAFLPRASVLAVLWNRLA